MEEKKTRSIYKSKESFSKKSLFYFSCSDNGYMWCVPVKILTSNNDVIEVLLDSKETIVTLDNMNEDDWFKINSGCVGYYRVHYRDEQDLNR